MPPGRRDGELNKQIDIDNMPHKPRQWVKRPDNYGFDTKGKLTDAGPPNQNPSHDDAHGDLPCDRRSGIAGGHAYHYGTTHEDREVIYRCNANIAKMKALDADIRRQMKGTMK